MKSSCLSVCQSCRFLRLPSWASALLLELHTIKFGKSQAQLRLQQKQSVTPHTMRSWLANERRLHQDAISMMMMQQNSYRINLQNQKFCTYKFPSECDLDTANRFAFTAMGLPAPEHCGMEHCRPARTCAYLHAHCTLNAPDVDDKLLKTPPLPAPAGVQSYNCRIHIDTV